MPPINRFLAAINKSLLHQIGKKTQFLGLVLRIEREIRILPIAQHAQAFELAALDVDEFSGVSLAGFADVGGIKIGGCALAHLLRDLEFNGQSVAIPARNIRGAIAAHALELNDNVLKDLIEGRANMHIAIGEGRSVVKYEPGCARAQRLNTRVKLGGAPFFEPLRFTRGEIGFHGKARLRQIQ